MLERCPGVDQAERALELADAAFARFDVDAVVAHLSAAIRGFTAAGEKCRAAMACMVAEAVASVAPVESLR
jgi:hypothetical protein